MAKKESQAIAELLPLRRSQSELPAPESDELLVLSLRARHPALTIVHVTLPLQIDPGTLFHWKTVVRGKQTPYRTLNTVRARYNALLREAYAGKEPFFDLAHFQALLPDGSIGAVRAGGLDVEYLAREWSSDGGHLNAEGQRRVAQAFLVTLAKLPDRS